MLNHSRQAPVPNQTEDNSKSQNTVKKTETRPDKRVSNDAGLDKVQIRMKEVVSFHRSTSHGETSKARQPQPHNPEAKLHVNASDDDGMSRAQRRPPRRTYTISNVQDVINSLKDARHDVRKVSRSRHQSQDMALASPWVTPSAEDSVNKRKPSMASTQTSLVESPISKVSLSEDVAALKGSRPSLSLGHLGPRASFQTMTKRVTNLLKFRNAMTPRKTSVVGGTNKDNVNGAEIVDNLPKTPRFSSFMSPEAQYAMMKGYEDVIADKLSTKYPEYNDMIKRNKTPHHSVAISEKSTLVATKLVSKHEVRVRARKPPYVTDQGASPTNIVVAENMTLTELVENNSDVGDVRNIQRKSSPSLNPDTVSQTRVPSPQQNAKETASSSLDNLRRLSLAFPILAANKADKSNELLMDSERVRTPLTRRHSVYSSSPLPHDRRIVLSYRMERAMDILDTIRPKWEHALSPRVKDVTRRLDAPVTDYNRWAEQWATEFKTDTVN
ncbi:unnamed protein product [Lymnaea stagnalis]|uniref:Uncharacterized protein n=1 Tax=Lymnaea stagnalis TaxID=6523 RepID=A0AAV2HWC1_LYMST